jgi:glycosyltransferase involved in cell wall biosynthesis
LAAVDVLLPVRNALDHLKASLESVLAQSFRDWRLLILDHGSTDGTVELAAQYADQDKRIKIFSNPHAEGLSDLLNFGLEKADCEFVLRQDGDDISLPNRFERTVEAFKADPAIVVIAGEANIIDEHGNTIGYHRRPHSPTAIKAAAFFSNPIIHPAAGFNLAQLDKLGAKYGRDILKVLPRAQSIEVHSLAEDYFLFGQLALLGKCRNLPGPLIHYRRHPKSESVHKWENQIGSALMVSRFLGMSNAVLKNVEDFDPAPFCAHGESLFDFGTNDYSTEFDRMERAMRRGLGDSNDLKRELEFRRILSNRSSVVMSHRYINFVAKHGFKTDEFRVVRNWLIRTWRPKFRIPIKAPVAPWRQNN